MPAPFPDRGPPSSPDGAPAPDRRPPRCPDGGLAAGDGSSPAGRRSSPAGLAFAVYGPIARRDLPGLCQRVCGLLAADPAPLVICDVGTVAPDAVTVEALARLRLAVRRADRQLVLQRASPELRALAALMGLAETLTPG